MENKIRLLDIAIDIDPTQVAGDTTVRHIQEEGSRVVYCVNSETLLLLQENGDWKTVVNASDQVLPGNAAVNSSVDEALGHKRDPFFFDGYLDRILDYMTSAGEEVLLVAENREQMAFIRDGIHGKWPYLSLSAVNLGEQESSSEHIVNEINSVAPALLIVALEERKQLLLLQNCRTQMNAGLALFTGGILYHQAVAASAVPESIQKLKMGHLYKWSKKDGRVRGFLNNLRMKLRLRQRKREDDD